MGQKRNGFVGNRKKIFYSWFNDKELLELDINDIPDSLSEEKLAEITSDIYQKYHEEIVTCAVCNQFTNISLAKLLSVQQFPKKMYALLKAPDGSGNWNTSKAIWCFRIFPKTVGINVSFPKRCSASCSKLCCKRKLPMYS